MVPGSAAIASLGESVRRRWGRADPLLPEPDPAPHEGCAEPLAVRGRDGTLAAAGACAHLRPPADSLSLAWSMAATFRLSAWVAGAHAGQPLDDLLSLWREHLARLPGARLDDTAAVVEWPSRDMTGVRALLRHGLQPLTILAARPAGRPTPAGGSGHRIRQATPADAAVAGALYLDVIRFDADILDIPHRPGVAAAVPGVLAAALARPRPWTWLAERDGRAVGLAVVDPPEEAGWVAPMTGTRPAAYLGWMGVAAEARGQGVGAALVAHLHRELDEAGIAVTLLHHGLLNPLSAPFWARMGYRPLWTGWEARPASALR
jgi:GNAT superfamily N-acetyltransferase